MMYCRVVDGQVLDGPRTLIPGLTAEGAAAQGWYPAVFLNMPHHIEPDCNPVTQVIQMQLTFTGEQVECLHVIEDKLPDAVAATQALLMDMVRRDRNEKLWRSDWTQLPDAPLTLAGKAAWGVYRQALRDFPSVVQLDQIVWPAEPAADA